MSANGTVNGPQSAMAAVIHSLNSEGTPADLVKGVGDLMGGADSDFHALLEVLESLSSSSSALAEQVSAAVDTNIPGGVNKSVTQLKAAIADLEAKCASLESERAGLSKDLEETAKTLEEGKTQWSNEKEAMEEAYTTLQSSLEQEKQGRQDDNAARDAAEAEAAAVNQNKLKEMAESHAKQVEDSAQEHKEKMENLVQEHKNKVEEVHAEYDGKIKEMTIESEAKLATAVREHETKLKSSIEDYEGRLRVAEEDHNSKMAASATEHETRLQQVKEDAEEKLKSVKEDAEEKLKSVKEEFEKQFEAKQLELAEVAKTAEETEKTLRNTITGLEKEAEQQKQGAQAAADAFAKESSQLKLHHEDKVADLMGQLEKAGKTLDELKDANAADIQKLREEMKAAVASEKEAAKNDADATEKRHGEEKAMMTDYHNREVQALKEQLAEITARLAQKESQYDTTTEGLRKELYDSRAERDDHKHKSEALEARLADVEARKAEGEATHAKDMERAEQTAAKLESSLEESRSELKSLEERLQGDITTLRSQNEEIKLEKASVAADLSKTQEILESERTRLQETHTELSSLKDTLKEVEQDRNGQIDALKQSISDLKESSANQLEQTKSDLTAAHTAAMDEITKANTEKVAELEGELRKNEKDCVRLQTSLEDANNQLGELKDKVKDMEGVHQDNISKTRQISDLEESYSEIKAQAEDTNSKFSAKCEEFAVVKSDLLQSKSALEAERKRTEELNTAVTEARSELKHMGNDLVQMRDTMKKMDAAKKDLNEKLNEVNLQNIQYRSDVSAFELKVSEMEEQKEVIGAACDQRDERIAGLESEINRLKAECLEVTSVMQSHEKIIESLEITKERLEKEAKADAKKIRELEEAERSSASQLGDAFEQIQQELLEKERLKESLHDTVAEKLSLEENTQVLMTELGLLRSHDRERLDEAMALLKAEAIPLTRQGEATMKRILTKLEATMYDSNVDSLATFKNAHLSIKKEVIDAAGPQPAGGRKWIIEPEHVQNIPKHQLGQLYKYFEEMVVTFDNMDEDTKNNLTTSREIIHNSKTLLAILRYVKANSARRRGTQFLNVEVEGQKSAQKRGARPSLPGVQPVFDVMTPGRISIEKKYMAVDPSYTPRASTFKPIAEGQETPVAGGSTSANAEKATPGSGHRRSQTAPNSGFRRDRRVSGNVVMNT